MAQITFRINTRPTYSERMTESRSELRKIIKDQLCECRFRYHSTPSRWAAAAARRSRRATPFSLPAPLLLPLFALLLLLCWLPSIR